MAITLDFESSNPSSNLGAGWNFFPVLALSLFRACDSIAVAALSAAATGGLREPLPWSNGILHTSSSGSGSSSFDSGATIHQRQRQRQQ